LMISQKIGQGVTASVSAAISFLQAPEKRRLPRRSSGGRTFRNDFYEFIGVDLLKYSSLFEEDCQVGLLTTTTLVGCSF
jgi:hypothetical protein